MAQVTVVKVAGAANSGPTGSFTSVTGRTYVVVIRNGINSAPTGVTSTNNIILRPVAGIVNGTIRLDVYTGVCTSGASGTVSATHGGSSNPNVNVLELPIGSYIRQTATSTGTGTAVSVTLSSLQAESATILAITTANNSGVSITPEAGFSNLSLTTSNPGEVLGIDKESDNDTTPSGTLSGSTTYAAMGLEVAWHYGSALSYVGQATGTNTATLPTHQAGDLIVVYAFRDGTATAPSLPAGWTNINTTTTTSTASRLGFANASSAAETVGTWTNATSVVAHVYRGIKWDAPVGGSSNNQGTTNTSVAWSNITLTDTGGTSWVFAGRGHRSVDTTLETAPSGLTNRSTVVDATDEAAGFDTAGTVSSGSTWTAPSSQNIGGTALRWTAQAAELRRGTAEPAVSQSSQNTTSVTSTTVTPLVTTNKNSGTIYVVVVPNGDTPSVAQIKAGQDSSGAAAPNTNSTVTGSGTVTLSAVTGLSPVTDYDVWFVHNWSGTDSTAVKADVTTLSGSAALFWAFP